MVQVHGGRLTGQLFAEATNINNADLDLVVRKHDGIFGLHCSTRLSKVPGDPPFLNMVKQGIVNQSVFAFYLAKYVLLFHSNLNCDPFRNQYLKYKYKTILTHS